MDTQNPHEAYHRRVKAEKIAAHLEAAGASSVDVIAEPDLARKAALIAGVNPPSEATIAEVVVIMEDREALAARLNLADPDHPFWDKAS